MTGLFFVWLYRRSRPGFRIFRNGFLAATAIALADRLALPDGAAARRRPRPRGHAPPLLRHRHRLARLRRPLRSGRRRAVAPCRLGARGRRRRSSLYARPVAVQAAGALYPAAVVLTILATGNHFVVDALAGVLVMALGFGLAALPAGIEGGKILVSVAGWSSQVARRAHNPEVAGSNPAPAISPMRARVLGSSCLRPQRVSRSSEAGQRATGPSER